MQDNNIITNLINFGLLDNAKELQGIKLLQCNYNIEIYYAEINSKKIAIKLNKEKTNQLLIEKKMLADLSSHQVKAPDVLFYKDNLLILEWIECENIPIRPKHEIEIARTILKLHSVKKNYFGYEYDTTIGNLIQPNSRYSKWIDFYRDNRLLHYSKMALNIGLINIELYNRIYKFSQSLEKYLIEPENASLIHGDLWKGNLLINQNNFVGLIDPSTFYGNTEYELAYLIMNGTFTKTFYEEYNDHSRIDKDFNRYRKDIYMLSPLIQYAIMNSGIYINEVVKILNRLKI
ncbi:MAG: fructosamine kinase family protein [Alphaproteobacteria bacterium]|jgi:fructosamine-3-kinase|tara:strand:+ start:4005 stop:4874 length:870 start_codon:yes stop_codon:yes gene_type:complete